ncbi:hypothetical protein CSOJ01_06795 [Colletotrichum sojae]|uniref:Uncharacterized protein n=1 Tax=Colletotrichum sojae TaxID=2175907 RepID=A0A8H6JB26_9PEZI|nr:hypothetical protein CSOJ01_06795 [Colletotrichum sojae]
MYAMYIVSPPSAWVEGQQANYAKSTPSHSYAAPHLGQPARSTQHTRWCQHQPSPAVLSKAEAKAKAEAINHIGEHGRAHRTTKGDTNHMRPGGVGVRLLDSSFPVGWKRRGSEPPRAAMPCAKRRCAWCNETNYNATEGRPSDGIITSSVSRAPF